MRNKTNQTKLFKSISYVVIICIIIVCAQQVSAQQIPVYSLHMFDKSLINPAFAGSGNQLSGTLLYKNKFVGFEGAPVTQVLSVHAPIQSKFMGIGFKVINDKIGETTETSFNILYSYQLGFAGGKLSLGLEGGLINYATDFDRLLKKDQVDEALPIGRESLILPEASTGFLYLADHMHFGVSVYNLIPSKLDKNTIARNPRAQLSKHFIISNGFSVSAGENLKLKPSWMLKYVSGAPAQLDFSLNAEFMETVSIGATYRTGDALVFLMRYSYAKQIHIAYAYDYTISEVSSYSGGAHELSIAYTLELMEPAMKKVVDPRYYY